MMYEGFSYFRIITCRCRISYTVVISVAGEYLENISWCGNNVLYICLYICLIFASQIISLFRQERIYFHFHRRGLDTFSDVVLILSIRGLLLRDWSPMLTMWFSSATHLSILCTLRAYTLCNRPSSQHKIIGACSTIELVDVREAASSVNSGTRKIEICFILSCEW